MVEEHEVAVRVRAGHNIPYMNDTHNRAIAPDPPEGRALLGHVVVELGDVDGDEFAAVRRVPGVIAEPRAVGGAVLDDLVDDVGRGGDEEFGAEGHAGT